MENKKDLLDSEIKQIKFSSDLTVSQATKCGVAGGDSWQTIETGSFTAQFE